MPARSVLPRTIFKIAEGDLDNSLRTLTDMYDELSYKDLRDDILSFKKHMFASNVDQEDFMNWSVLQFLEYIVKEKLLETHQNLALALQLLLTVCASVASAERSFSVLKLIESMFILTYYLSYTESYL